MNASDVGPVVGVVGADVPREVVLAAGALPVRLGGELSTPGRPDGEVDHTRAADLLGTVDETATEVLRWLLTGAASGFAGIVCCRDRDASLRLYYVLRELRARGADLPPVHLVDLLHLDRPGSLRYNIAQVRRLAGVVSGWTGRVPDADGLAASVAACATVRSLLARMQEARASGQITGVEAHRLYGAAQTLAPEIAAARIRVALDVARTDGTGLRPLFLSGSPQPHPWLYTAVEDAGWTVTSEDHDRGALELTVRVDRASAGDVGEWYAAIAEAYLRRGPDAPTASAVSRASWAASTLPSSRAEGVLSYVRRHDEAPLWDWPRLRDAAASAGLPAVLLRDQASAPDPEQLGGALASLSSVAFVGAGR